MSWKQSRERKQSNSKRLHVSEAKSSKRGVQTTSQQSDHQIFLQRGEDKILKSEKFARSEEAKFKGGC